MSIESTGPGPLAEAQVMELQDIAKRYTAGCSFKIGDLITPRAGYNVREAGRPHIVLEVSEEAKAVGYMSGPFLTPESTSMPMFGGRLDLRVAVLVNGQEFAAYWVESWCFEEYTGPGV